MEIKTNKMEVFNKLLETIEKGAVNNQITITNVELFIQSWKREVEMAQLHQYDVSGQSDQLCPECKSKNVEIDYGLGELYCHDCENIVGA